MSINRVPSYYISSFNFGYTLDDINNIEYDFSYSSDDYNLVVMCSNDFVNFCIL